MPGSARARTLTASAIPRLSARSERRNFSLAGVARKRSVSSTTVPEPSAAGRTAETWPPSTVIEWAVGAPASRLVTVNRPAAPMEGSASPRNPNVVMLRRSSPSDFDVACRDTASGRSSPAIPLPSSTTRTKALPPLVWVTVIRLAPASTEFSTSSLTTEAGRSTTSPAAMRLMAASSSFLMRLRSGEGLPTEPVIPRQ